jgi:hypothetical protein
MKTVMRERLFPPTLSRVSYRVRIPLALYLLLLAIGTTLWNAQGVITRRGAFVYTGNTPWGSPSNALVNGYAINATAGTLSKVPGTPFATGGQVLAIASHPSGRFAYVASGNGTVAAFTVDSLDGSLTPVPGSPYTVARQDRERCWRLIGGDVSVRGWWQQPACVCHRFNRRRAERSDRVAVFFQRVFGHGRSVGELSDRMERKRLFDLCPQRNHRGADGGRLRRNGLRQLFDDV